jgi:hypothetical protein
MGTVLARVRLQYLPMFIHAGLVDESNGARRRRFSAVGPPPGARARIPCSGQSNGLPLALLSQNPSALRYRDRLRSTRSIQLPEYGFDVRFDGSDRQRQV